MVIYSGFSHSKWWFSIAMLVYQRVCFFHSKFLAFLWLEGSGTWWILMATVPGGKNLSRFHSTLVLGAKDPQESHNEKQKSKITVKPSTFRDWSLARRKMLVFKPALDVVSSRKRQVEGLPPDQKGQECIGKALGGLERCGNMWKPTMVQMEFRWNIDGIWNMMEL